jgi:hypothetical protein
MAEETTTSAETAATETATPAVEVAATETATPKVETEAETEAAFVPEPPVVNEAVTPTASAATSVESAAATVAEETETEEPSTTASVAEPSSTSADAVIEQATELLDVTAFKGTTIGSGSLYGAQANKLLNSIRDGSLDYVIVSTTARNGLDRAVIVGEKLFASISKLFVFNTLKKQVSWVLQAPSLSRDELFAGNTAIEIVASPLQRPGVATVLLQVDVVFGYIIGASDFHAAFKA